MHHALQARVDRIGQAAARHLFGIGRAPAVDQQRAERQLGGAVAGQDAQHPPIGLFRVAAPAGARLCCAHFQIGFGQVGFQVDGGSPRVQCILQPFCGRQRAAMMVGKKGIVRRDVAPRGKQRRRLLEAALLEPQQAGQTQNIRVMGKVLAEQVPQRLFGRGQVTLLQGLPGSRDRLLNLCADAAHGSIG